MPVEVHVVTPEREVWSGEAATRDRARRRRARSASWRGHAPLLVQLAIGPLRILREGEAELRAPSSTAGSCT